MHVISRKKLKEAAVRHRDLEGPWAERTTHVVGRGGAEVFRFAQDDSP